ncbi:MAG TPA: hypothetical protein DCF65_02965 [Chloroflexi bacterium]|jgi:uncharacterized protein YukE|nr:hypothetical protein [Chloroflexota bacterium]HAF20591.1 hypothetical protein [Chloroflexota bacterium]
MSKSGGFRVSPDSLKTAAQRTQRAAEDLAAATEKLRSRVLGAGSPWGGDEMGTVFASAYTEGTQLGLEVLGDLAQHLEEMATSLAQMSENTKAADDANAAGFKQLY